MDATQIIIISAVVIIAIFAIGYAWYTSYTNRKYKPIEIQEAEELAKQLIKRRYGKGCDHMKLFYDEFIKEFPVFESLNYTYILQCFNPNNRERKNADLIESALIFLGRPLIVEGSIRHDSYLAKQNL